MNVEINDFVQIRDTKEYGIVQAEYPNGTFLIDLWDYYKTLFPNEFIRVDKRKVPKHLWSRIQTRVKN